MWSPNGLLDAVASTVRVEQENPLSPTLVSLYIDSVYIERVGGLGTCLEGIAIPILLYADDIFLIAVYLQKVQRHPNTLKSSCI